MTDVDVGFVVAEGQRLVAFVVLVSGGKVPQMNAVSGEKSLSAFVVVALARCL